VGGAWDAPPPTMVTVPGPNLDMGEGQLISDAANEARASLGAGKWGGEEWAESGMPRPQPCLHGNDAWPKSWYGGGAAH